MYLLSGLNRYHLFCSFPDPENEGEISKQMAAKSIKINNTINYIVNLQRIKYILDNHEVSY